MRKYDNQVQKIKSEVLKTVAKFSFEGNLMENIYDIPKIVNPGPDERYRCCVYHERAITEERVKMALGGNKSNPNIVEVLETACDKCPVNRFFITEACRGCLAHKCQISCPFDAITIEKGKAKIDQSKCKECGKCKEACPYDSIADVMRPCRRVCPTGAISIDDRKKAVIDFDKCIECGACVYQCPFGAIQDKSEIVKVIDKIIEGKKNVYAIIAPAFATQFNFAKHEEIVAGIKALGFKDVIEVALGADLVVKHESEEFVHYMEEKDFMTSSCCPAFVKFIDIKYPELKENISTTVSPMIATSRLVKSVDKDAVVVFIGPCIAKKREKDIMKEDIEYVLTFEELAAMIDAKDIKLDEIGEMPLNNASYFGRKFAASGGVTAAIKNEISSRKLEIDFNPVICNGINECDKALKMGKVKRLDGNFIEGMACSGGCIKGPVTMHHGRQDLKSLETYCEMTVEETPEKSLRVFDLNKINMER
jgi:[FeFe] hydrogenase (group B1/B3)